MNSDPAVRRTGMSGLLVEQARAGSEGAYAELVAPRRRELQVHCYRMLGSVEDAEDAVQETLLRAWSKIEAYSGASSFRAWLYAIATNVCLDALRRRKSRQWPTDVVGPSDPQYRPEGPREVAWLQPYPDAMLPESAEPSAEDVVVGKETIELAFLAAIQHLPPRQRAVLILRDVLNWSAKEAADALGMTSVAVNSALQRAHATLSDRMPERSDWPRNSSADEREVLDGLITAWESANVDAIVGMLAADARFVMPPLPTWYEGRPDIASFFRTYVFNDPGVQSRLVPTRANGQPAFALYKRPVGGKDFRPFGVGVVRPGPEGIEEIALFIDNPRLFEIFGLPAFV